MKTFLSETLEFPKITVKHLEQGLLVKEADVN